MKNKKGFTLVEIIGVIAVLAVITIITVPTILRTLKENENEKYNAFLKDLFLASETYITANNSMYPELKTVGGTATISIKLLRDEKLIRKSLINPKTNERVLDTQGIKVIVQADQTNEYTFENGVDYYTINNYISSDLFLQYDGIKNESRIKPHSTTLKTWNNVAPNANNYNGTMLGFNYNETSGWLGDNGVLFDGVDDYVDAGFKQDQLGQNFTICVTFNITEISDYRGLWGYHKGTPYNQGVVSQASAINNDLSFSFYTTTGGAGYAIPASKVLNKKIQVIVVFQGGIGVRVYLNGNLEGSAFSNAPFNPIIDYNFMVGKSYPATDRHFKGSMYNFMIYTRALTDDEVKQNYNVDKVRYSL